MRKSIEEVMSSQKGSIEINTVPTKETVDYCRIYCYTDPEVVENTFGFYEANRDFKGKSHEREIARDIQTAPYGSEFIAPIRVDINTYRIADGQNRVWAILRAWRNGSAEPLKVIYEDYPVEDTEAMRIIARINSTNKNWGLRDYEKNEKTQGNDSVKLIDEFAKTHALCHTLNKNGKPTVNTRYTHAVIFGRNMTKELKDGTIYADKDDIALGEQMHGEVSVLVDALGYEMNSWFEAFTQAWWEIRNKDGAYSSIVADFGIQEFAEYLRGYSRSWHPLTRKVEWLERLRSALWAMKEDKRAKVDQYIPTKALKCV